MKPERKGNNIPRFWENCKTQVSRVKEVHKDPEKSMIREEHIGNRNMFRVKTEKVKDVPDDNQNEENKRILRRKINKNKPRNERVLEKDKKGQRKLRKLFSHS